MKSILVSLMLLLSFGLFAQEQAYSDADIINLQKDYPSRLSMVEENLESFVKGAVNILDSKLIAQTTSPLFLELERLKKINEEIQNTATMEDLRKFDYKAITEKIDDLEQAVSQAIGLFE